VRKDIRLVPSRAQESKLLTKDYVRGRVRDVVDENE
jgi:hypothetical protein